MKNGFIYMMFFFGCTGAVDNTPVDLSLILPRCDDHRKNGQETDIDCGGSCASCLLGQKCEKDDDCIREAKCELISHICIGCNDLVKNGDESDIDCGGICQRKCPIDRKCYYNNDCETQVCIEGLCAAKCELGALAQCCTDADCCKYYPPTFVCDFDNMAGIPVSWSIPRCDAIYYNRTNGIYSSRCVSATIEWTISYRPPDKNEMYCGGTWRKIGGTCAFR